MDTEHAVDALAQDLVLPGPLATAAAPPADDQAAAVFSLDELLHRMAPFEGELNTDSYQEFCGLLATHPMAGELRGIEPFSGAYRQAARRLYSLISGRPDYRPERDERSPGLPKTFAIVRLLRRVRSRLARRGKPADAPRRPVRGRKTELFTSVSPWWFESATMMAEFMAAWAAMLRHMPAKPDADILEYGPGSGQLLLSLARLGYRAYGVDIEPNCLSLIQRQARAMGVTVHTERAEFGAGFAGKRFDRIVFFEAFHHAPEFLDLLCRLHDRITADGRLILCGEPVIPAAETGPVPFPWGPRLDGLSVYCMRRWGWMELGFQRAFLMEALLRTGWIGQYFPGQDCFRADVYLARPWRDTLHLGEPVELGTSGWSHPEGTHRWTTGDAELPMPALRFGCFDVAVSAVNFLPQAVSGRLSCGTVSTALHLEPNQDAVFRLSGCTAPRLRLQVPGRIPADIVPGLPDHRTLGMAVRSVTVTPASAAA